MTHVFTFVVYNHVSFFLPCVGDGACLYSFACPTRFLHLPSCSAQLHEHGQMLARPSWFKYVQTRSVKSFHSFIHSLNVCVIIRTRSDTVDVQGTPSCLAQP